MIRYDRLWATMEAQGMTQYRLIKHYNFSAGQIGRLKKNMHVSTHTLDTLCTLLGCDISDIIEYIPEGSPAPEEPSVPEAGSAEKETSSKSRKSLIAHAEGCVQGQIVTRPAFNRVGRSHHHLRLWAADQADARVHGTAPSHDIRCVGGWYGLKLGHYLHVRHLSF